MARKIFGWCPSLNRNKDFQCMWFFSVCFPCHMHKASWSENDFFNFQFTFSTAKRICPFFRADLVCGLLDPHVIYIRERCRILEKWTKKLKQFWYTPIVINPLCVHGMCFSSATPTTESDLLQFYSFHSKFEFLFFLQQNMNIFVRCCSLSFFRFSSRRC